LYTAIPEHLFATAQADKTVKYHNKMNFLVDIPLHFSSDDRMKFEKALVVFGKVKL
jgi:hypothetical protein